MFGHFTSLVADASGWAYLVLFLFALLDAVLPVVPSEASLITAGAVAANGGLDIPIVIAVAAAGAFLGDNTAYLLGRYLGDWARGRFFSGEKGQRRVKWAEAQLEERGGQLIVVGRFIPGGRTLVALTAGSVRFRWRRFATFDVVAALTWALYAGLLGYAGGHAFEDHPWAGLLLAFGIAVVVSVGSEVIRAYIKRRRQRDQ
jgi:membrane protein DedA with SNARE-associated domain